MERSIKIPSNLNNLSEVEDFFKQIHIDYSIPRKLYCRLYLAVNEALINAIVHGNKLNPEKFIIIHFYNLTDKFHFKIQDEGSGFNTDSIPDPLSSDNLRKECGRGIFIIKHYTDNFYFENNGTIINLIFNKL